MLLKTKVKEMKKEKVKQINKKDSSEPKKIYILKPPLEVKCMNCKCNITVLFCPPRQGHSNKNHWGWWTQKPEDEGCYKCDNCIIDLYKNHKIEYLNSITSSQKRSLLRSYLYNSIVE